MNTPYYELSLTLVDPKGRLWKTNGEIHWDKYDITIPQGFITDLASVPRIVWWLIPPYGTYTINAIIHDYVYKHKLLPRRQADTVFLQDFDPKFPIPKWEKFSLYWGVRIFGGLWYHELMVPLGLQRPSK